ncbi:MAG: JAB domain-containing protein [Cyclobacteriaceae bacterium]
MSNLDLFKIAQIDLVYRHKVKASERPRITHSEDAAKLFRENWDDLTINLCEEFKLILLNRNNRVLGLSKISQGGVTGTVVDPKIIFGLALKSLATGIILAHNHPSGNTKPSRPDINITKKLVNAGDILEINIIDHIILTEDSHFSFADNCML